jgi:hypothetical protein
MKTLFFLLTLTFLAAGPTRATEPHAYPVPYVHKDASPKEIFFKDLPGEGTVKIFTVAGDEVRSLVIPMGQGQIRWDVKNASGKLVASGVYIYEIDAAGQQKTGKLVVIR